MQAVSTGIEQTKKLVILEIRAQPPEVAERKKHGLVLCGFRHNPIQGFQGQMDLTSQSSYDPSTPRASWHGSRI